MNIDFRELVRKIDTRYKVVFLSTFLCGLLAQGMGLFNKYSVLDDPVTYDGFKNSYHLGRWMLALVGKLEFWLFGAERYSMPTFNGAMAMFFIAATTCVIVEMLEIKDLFLCTVVASLMVSFPVVTCTFAYMYVAPHYMFSLFIGALGAFFLVRKDKRIHFIIGLLLICASIGMYQAYLPVITTIMLIYLLGQIVTDDNLLNVWKKLGKTALGCVLFMALYFIVMKISLIITGEVLTSYRGISSMGNLPIGEYLNRVLFAYNEFFTPTEGAGFYMYLGNIVNIYRLVLAVGFVLGIDMLINVFKKSKIRACICCILLILLPLSTNLIFVMVDKSQVYSLMVYGALFPFIFFIWLVEHSKIDNKYIGKGLSWATAIVTVLLVLMFSRVDNRCYLKATYVQSETISYFNTLITQIKETDGYRENMPVAYVNEGQIQDAMLNTGDNRHLADIVLEPYYDVYGYVNCYSWKSFMWQWCGFAPERVDANEFAEMDEVKEMPHYPDDGSIKVINDTLVVNF
ncbi:MAG: glucosyltransferase domain-containing protein [Butyrivibrio sp.]|uniref:glucosyltransferase domain-containing protein n=1 Tax=Butyrivibrio sp. TaxID=28121 RepID=UPI0025C2586C|nr:glucosyltransferase domain-containing protein [Butyrivibrio sp.]MBQ6587164.1 glucosyltransferase domain-containing protein [Butyrivibrio sp.]